MYIITTFYSEVFFISSIIIKATEGKGGKSLEEAQSQKNAMKAEAKGVAVANAPVAADAVKKIIFACDAGMGSSAMGATKFRNRIKDARPEIVVKNSSVDNIPADCDIAVVQATLQDRARAAAPQAKLVIINNFLADPALDALYAQLVDGDTKAEETLEDTEDKKKLNNQVLIKESIKLNQPSVTKEEAIRAAGELLVERGSVEPSYVEAMLEREKIVTTYMGMGIAIPHGTSEAKGAVKKTAITMLQYPEGVDFGDEKAQLVFGIAGIGDEHLDLLGKIAGTLDDPEVLEKSPFELSGGQKRRAAIAGVMAMEPEVLILDDPTAGLDPKGRDEILDMIRSYHDKHKTTIILVTHSMEDAAKMANRIVVMCDSQVLLDGTPSEIFANHELLTKSGLDVPQITSVLIELKNRGYDVDTSVYTIEGAKEQLMKLRGKV